MDLLLSGCGGGIRTTRPPGYEPDKLPAAPLRDVEMLLYAIFSVLSSVVSFEFQILVLMAGLEPARVTPADFKSAASADSATRATQ